MRLRDVLASTLRGHPKTALGIGASVCAAIVMAIVMVTATATAWAGGQAQLAVGLTSTGPDTPSGLNVHLLLLRAGDPNAKPPPLRSVVIQGPDGLRFDTAAVPQCTASDVEIHLLGAGACPANSALTVGSFTGLLGFGPPIDPFVGDDHVFNGQSQLIEIITAHGNPSLSPASDRLTISGSTLTAHPPAVPGPPPDNQASVRSIDFQIPVRVSSGRALITAPPDCPPGGVWTTKGTFEFTDGSTATVTSDTPCDRGASPAAATEAAPASPGGPPPEPARVTVAVHPTRAVAGTRTRFHIAVAASVAQCVLTATARLGAHTVTVDRSGRGSALLTFRHPGVRRLTVVSHGCVPAQARILVEPRRAPGR